MVGVGAPGPARPGSIKESRIEVLMDGKIQSEVLEPNTVQKYCIDYITNANTRSLLLTAEAGAGKTTVVNWCIEKMVAMGLSVTATAPSAVAANRLIDGKTLHRAFGVRPGWDADACLARGNEELISSVRTCNVLFIDECSMVSIELLETVDKICRSYKGVNSPLGGIKVIFAGDFAQLPPVARSQEGNRNLLHDQNAEGFRKYFSKVLYLPCNFRQRPEGARAPATGPKKRFDKKLHANFEASTPVPPLLSLLRGIRTGQLSAVDLDRLRSRVLTPDQFADKLARVKSAIRTYKMPVYITGTNESARQFNVEVVKGFGEPVSVYPSSKSESGVALCKGCRVIFLINKKWSGIFNGSLGTVLECKPKSVVIQFDELSAPEEVYDNETVDNKKCLPVLPLYALTIHKAQGMTIEGDLLCNLSGLFEDGMGYTALSRCKSIENLFLVDSFSDRTLSLMNGVAVKMYQTIHTIYQSSGRLLYGKRELGFYPTRNSSPSTPASPALSVQKQFSVLSSTKDPVKTMNHKALLAHIEVRMKAYVDEFCAEYE